MLSLVVVPCEFGLFFTLYIKLHVTALEWRVDLEVDHANHELTRLIEVLVELYAHLAPLMGCLWCIVQRSLLICEVVSLEKLDLGDLALRSRVIIVHR